MASAKVLAFVACVALLTGNRALLDKPAKPAKPVPTNSANAIQSNSVTGAYDGGSQPYTEGGSITTSYDGNAYNYGPVTSGNQANQNGQSNSASQASTINPPPPPKRSLLGHGPPAKPPPKPVPSNSANAIQSNSVTGAADGGSQPYTDKGTVSSYDDGNAYNWGPVTSGNQANQNGQGNSASQASTINPPPPPKRSLLGHGPPAKPPPKPVPSNSANAIQSNSVTGAADGGSQPYTDKGTVISSGDGNAYNYAPVTSGNQANQNGQGNSASQASTINPPPPPKRSLLGHGPPAKPPPKPAPSNSANAIQSNSVTGAADGGSQPYTDKGGVSSSGDGNAKNYAPVTSGNQVNQNGQGNSASQASTINPPPPPKTWP